MLTETRTFECNTTFCEGEKSKDERGKKEISCFNISSKEWAGVSRLEWLAFFFLAECKFTHYHPII